MTGRETTGAPGAVAQPLFATTHWSVVLAAGQAEQTRRFFSEQEIACPGLLQKDMAVARACQAQGTPARYLIKAEGN